MTAREKVLRDALKDIAAKGGRTQHRNGCICEACIARAALAAADAIPDAPVVTKVIYPNTPTCPTCKTWFSSLCSDGYHAPIPAAPLPHASVIADGRQVGTLVTAQRIDLRESQSACCPTCNRAHPPVYPTALQILWAALEEQTTCSCCSCACRANATTALEAADKVPGLADDTGAINAVATDFATGTGCRICANRSDGKPCAPCRAYAMIAMRAIDAYQRGGAKP